MEIAEPELILFRVAGIHYEIPLAKIRAFPLKEALVNVLTEKFLNKSFGVSTTPDNEIIIEPPQDSAFLETLNLLNNRSSKRLCFTNFEKVVRLYDNPEITLFELLDLQIVIDLIDACRKQEQFGMRDVLDTNPQYNFIRKSNYSNFLKEMEFYGLRSFFQTSSLVDGVDLRAMKKRFKKNFRALFDQTSSSKDENGDALFYRLLSLGGIFSGSFTLNAVLGEDWGNDNPKDIDVYIPIEMLEARFGEKTRYTKRQIFTERALQIEETVRKTAGPKESDQDAAIDKLRILPSQFFNQMESIELPEKEHWKVISKSLKEYLEAKSAKIADSGLPEAYEFTKHIHRVIKLDMGTFNMDVVVVTSTIPYMLERNFDFDFCTVYYDGYNMNALDWDALIDRCSIEWSHRRIGPLEYYDNADRIAKYMRRGFVVLADNDDRWTEHKRSKKEKKAWDKRMTGPFVFEAIEREEFE